MSLCAHDAAEPSSLMPSCSLQGQQLPGTVQHVLSNMSEPQLSLSSTIDKPLQGHSQLMEGQLMQTTRRA